MRLQTLRLIFMFMFYQVIIYGQQVKFSYQAVFRDSSGELLTERLIGIRLSILNEKSELQYTERHQIKTNNLGLGTLILGDGTEKTGILESIQWGKGALDLKTEVDVLGGKNYGIQSMAPILSVPYAFYTGIADSLRGGRLLPKDAKKGEILYWDGQIWQKLSAGKPGQWLGVSPDGNLQWQFPIPLPGIKDMEILRDNSKIHNPIIMDIMKLGREKTDIGLNKDIQNKDSLFTAKDMIQQFEVNKMYQTLSNEAIGSEPVNNPEITDRLEKKLLSNLPVLTTTVPGSITTSTANGGGVISSDVGTPVTVHGVVWSTSPAPALTVSTEKSKGSFTSSITGLAPNTTYYVRAYATNSAGTAYGNELSFKTTAASTVPTLTTSAISAIATTTATSGGNVTAPGSATVTLRGVVWSTSPTPTISLSTKTSNGGGTGSFTSSLTGLTPNTTYYVRAYATSSAGTAYGNELSFKTTAAVTVPILTTSAISGIATTTATGGGNVMAPGSATVTARGVVWSTSPVPTISLSTKTSNGGGTGSFTSSLTGLTPNTIYYVRAYATSSAGTAYGNELSFKTTAASTVPTLTTSAISAIATTTATSGGNVTAPGSATVTLRGVVWSTSPVPTISLSTKTSNGGGTGSFTSSLTGLTPNTTYYVRAYATSSAGTAYGNELSFKTTAASTVPTLTTSAISAIATTTATSGGNVTAPGSATVTLRGVVWSTSPTPTISLSTKTSNGGGTGSFTSSLTGLTPNTIYYVRAYATSSAGTAYGNELSFKTTAAVTVPILTTSAISGIATTTATGGGNVMAPGSATVTARGVVWSTSPVPTISLSTKTSNGGGTGSFTSSLTGLAPNTIYYVRAYATSSAGTAYGNELSFKTTAASTVPTLTTSAISAIATTTATSGGNVTAPGSATVTLRGVVWSTSPTPTISLSTKTSNGGGTGSFTSSLTGLTPNTTYYVRAYATNSAGTAYGNDVTFKTTAAAVPILSTTAINTISATTAVGGGNISADGGAPVTVRGVVWSKSPGPTIALSTKTRDGSGKGSFTSSLKSLTPNTTYYVRSYATNSVGTAYGNEIKIKTLENPFKVICGLDIPPGWMYYRTISNSLWSSYCGSNEIAIEIVNIKNLPVGSELNICFREYLPSGWRVVRTFSEICDEWTTQNGSSTRFWDCCMVDGGTAPVGFFANDRLRKLIIKEK